MCDFVIEKRLLYFCLRTLRCVLLVILFIKQILITKQMFSLRFNCLVGGAKEEEKDKEKEGEEEYL